ncbi:MAG: hypothetical protein JO142_08680 [Burkholderiales bacterium]|nr:hypothetical protein [Burkholderiales bacterium]
MVVFFTSVTTNYIPKARALAASAKRHNPDAHFMLLLSDARPAWLDLDQEPFDSVVTSDSLGIPQFRQWVFKHSVVELCTAVKGFAFQWVFREMKADKVLYLDPDMIVYAPLTPLLDRLDQASILLTPHQCEPEETHEAIVDNEICSLKHGVFNLGFLGLRNSDEGRRFADWWAARLEHYCYDDIPGGIFTDQRWVDLAPCFFDDLAVVRDPAYNVSTWNLTHRTVSGDPAAPLVNGQPLRLYHFSGFDSGAQGDMLKKYGGENPTLWAMREWYIAECERLGQTELGKTPYAYGTYDNGDKIETRHRIVYRGRVDLMKAFPDPFVVEGRDSYLKWYQREMSDDAAMLGTSVPVELLRQEYSKTRDELTRIVHSRSWRLARRIASLARLLRLA